MCDEQTTMREFFSRPSQMLFWSKPERLVEFLLIQAEFYHAGAGHDVSKTAIALENCAKEIIEIYKLSKQEDKKENN